MQTLEQRRAKLAFEHVQEIAKSASTEDKKKYGAIVHALVPLLRSAGLAQSLAFVQSRSDAQKKLMSHLASQLQRVDGEITDPRSLLDRTLNADLQRYMRLTNEAIACATWYRRFVQGILGVDAAERGE